MWQLLLRNFHHQKKATESTAATIMTEALMYELKEPAGAGLGVHAAFLTEAEKLAIQEAAV